MFIWKKKILLAKLNFDSKRKGQYKEVIQSDLPGHDVG